MEQLKIIDEDIAIAFCQWSDLAIKNGEFPKNPNGTSMNYREAYNYFINSDKKNIYLRHAKTLIQKSNPIENKLQKAIDWCENKQKKADENSVDSGQTFYSEKARIQAFQEMKIYLQSLNQ